MVFGTGSSAHYCTIVSIEFKNLNHFPYILTLPYFDDWFLEYILGHPGFVSVFLL